MLACEHSRSFDMRIMLFVFSVIVVTAGLGSRAEAQNYPWCAVYDVGDNAYNCGFVTRDQCMATVSGIGGFCQPNDQYQPPGGVSSRRKSHAHY
jgi:hypothetical protein